MRILRSSILSLVAMAIGAAACAQTDVWDLQRCLDHARQENLSMRQAMLNIESANEDVRLAKSAFAPSVSASSSQAVSYSPLFDNGQFAYSANYNIGASMTLYDGGKLIYSKKLAALTAEIREAGLLSSRKELEMNILTAYLQVLYAHEALLTAQENMVLADADLDRAKILRQAGKITVSELAQVESQWSQDNYNLTAGRNALRTAVMNLKHLLELEIDTPFDIAYPEISDLEVMESLPEMMAVYERALQSMPQIKEAQQNLESSELNTKIARSGWYPSLSLSASIGGNYNTLRLPDESLGSQFVGSLGPSLSLGINIPIYDRRQTRTSVNKAKINRQQSQLNYEQAVKTVATYVESLYIDAESAQANYQAAKKKQEAAEESYRYTSEQYKAGMRNTVELLNARQSLIGAQETLTRSRYQAVISLQLLNIIQDYPVHIGANQ
ncbi:MAG: TolC family protein [Paludibacteraceae bacterium]|nr:TolC family protein [Paludibacteraceae bacterium]